MTTEALNGAGANLVRFTTAAEIRRAREQGFRQTLPDSLFEVYVRPLAPDRLLALGEIPPRLRPDIERILYGGDPGVDPFGDALDGFAKGAEAGFDAERQREVTEFVAFINRVCCAALVTPRMVLESASDEEIEPADLPLGDRFWIYRLCTQSVEVLRKFQLQMDAAESVVSEPEA